VADAEAASIAAKAIIGAKKKKILGLFGNPELLITQKRQQSFMEQIALGADPVPVTIRYANNSKDAMLQVVQSLESDNKPDAIFCMSDEILTGTMKALLVKKCKIPEEVGVISICNNGFIPSLFEPEITYVETSGFELGKLAVKRIFDHMGGKTFVQELILPSRLVSGHSL
jgi:LacI family transcriptional regulator